VLWNGSVFLPYAKSINQDIRLFGAHHNDGVNNIALIKSLQYSLPPMDPNYSGRVIKNYHYFINLILAAIQKVTQIDPFILYFGIAPTVMIIILSILVYFFVLTQAGKLPAVLAILFVNFLGNYYYLGPLLGSVNLHPSIAWMDEYSTRLVNYQLLSSYILLMVLLLFLIRRRPAVLVGLISGLLMGFKVYAWILWELGLLAFSWRNKYFFRAFLWSVLFSLPVGWLLYQPGGQATFIFKPLWIIKSMYESPDRFNLVAWELARQTYLSIRNYLGIFKLYFQGVVAFLIINFGPRLLGFFAPKNYLLKILTFLGIILPLLLAQSGSSWNVIQFSYYSVFFLSLLLAISLSRFPRLVVVLFILISLPSALYINSQYLNPPYTVSYSRGFVQALDTLARLPQGTVLSHPSYSTNAVVSALSSKPVFIAESMILTSSSIDTRPRQQFRDKFFSGMTLQPKDFLSENNISYIISPQYIDISKYMLLPIFQNSEVIIYSTQ